MAALAVHNVRLTLCVTFMHQGLSEAELQGNTYRFQGLFVNNASLAEIALVNMMASIMRMIIM